MSTQKAAYGTPHYGADQLLKGWAKADLELKKLEAEAAAALAEVQQEWAEKLKSVKEKLARYDCTLKDFMKLNREALFPVAELGSFSVDIPHGTLTYDKTEYVVKPRKVDVLGNLERYGFEEAIIRTKETNWQVLANKDEWPDEALAIIGTRRETKESYGFETKELPLKGK